MRPARCGVEEMNERPCIQVWYRIGDGEVGFGRAPRGYEHLGRLFLAADGQANQFQFKKDWSTLPENLMQQVAGFIGESWNNKAVPLIRPGDPALVIDFADPADLRYRQ